MFVTEITIKTEKEQQLIEITEQIRRFIAEQGWQEGLLLLYLPHTTAGLFLHQNVDKEIEHDLLKTLSNLIPERAAYEHQDGVAHAHIKSVLSGNQVIVPIVGEKMQIGRWEGIFISEFAGPRERKIRFYFIKG